MLTAVLAATLDVAEKINQFGAYAGLAAIVGLAVLSLLYFSQAREVKRLREWAGRSPERAAELEAAATQAAQQRLAPQAPAQPRPRPTSPATPASAAGQSTTVSPARPIGAPAAAVPAVRQQVPPGQAVTAAGTPSPATPQTPGGPQVSGAAPAVGAAAAAVAGAAGVAGATPTTSGQQPTTATPATATPAATPPGATPPGGATAPGAPLRPAPAPAPPQTARAQSSAPLRAPTAAAYQSAGSRPRTADAQRELGVEGRSPLRSTLMIVGGVIAVAIVVFVLVTQIFGGDDSTPVANTIATTGATTPKTETTAAKTKKKAKTTPDAVVRGDTTVAVLNGTTTQGLAASELATVGGKGFKTGVTGDAPVKPVETTTIYYAIDKRSAADEVAGALGLPATSIKAMDATVGAVSGVAAADVVVVVGADQAAG